MTLVLKINWKLPYSAKLNWSFNRKGNFVHTPEINIHLHGKMFAWKLNIGLYKIFNQWRGKVSAFRYKLISALSNKETCKRGTK